MGSSVKKGNKIQLIKLQKFSIGTLPYKPCKRKEEYNWSCPPTVITYINQGKPFCILRQRVYLFNESSIRYTICFEPHRKHFSISREDFLHIRKLHPNIELAHDCAFGKVYDDGRFFELFNNK